MKPPALDTDAADDGEREASGFEILRRFLQTEVSMSHVYQPLMIKTILEGGGTATRRQVAAAFLAADLSQLEYYEHVVSRYPVKTLRKHRMIEANRGVYRLDPRIGRMDDWQRAALVSECAARVADYVAERRSAIWAHRGRRREPVPGSLRWQVITRAMGRCEACGISSMEEALVVDHIVPRSRGGTNDRLNLQALCGPCNLQKSDRDSTDFHAAHEAARHRRDDCPACRSEGMPTERPNHLAKIIPTDHGLAVVPLRHGARYVDLTQSEINGLRELELVVAERSGGSGHRCRMVGRSAEDAGHLHLLITHGDD